MITYTDKIRCTVHALPTCVRLLGLLAILLTCCTITLPPAPPCSRKVDTNRGRACPPFVGCVDSTSRASPCRHRRARTGRPWRQLESLQQRCSFQDRRLRTAHCHRRAAHQTLYRPSHPRFPLSSSPLAPGAHHILAKLNTVRSLASRMENCMTRHRV